MFSESAILPESCSHRWLSMLCITLWGTGRLLHKTNWIVKQTPPLLFCFKVVCIKVGGRGVFLEVYSICIQACLPLVYIIHFAFGIIIFACILENHYSTIWPLPSIVNPLCHVYKWVILCLISQLTLVSLQNLSINLRKSHNTYLKYCALNPQW